METDSIIGGDALSMDDAVKALMSAENAPALPTEPAKLPLPPEDDTTDDEPPEDDTEDEEAEDETGEEEQAEDDDDDEEESGKGRFAADNARVRLDDGRFATVAELKKGTLLQADYTRKTQETAELRRSVEGQSAAIKQRETQLNDQAEYVQSLIKSVLPPAPDSSMANPNSPNFNLVQYLADEASYKQWAAHLDYLGQQSQRSQQARQAETVAERNKRADEEWAKAVEKLPTLKDEKRLKAFSEDVKKFGAQYGYSLDELANAGLDHRQLLVLDKAIRWDKLQANKAKVPAKVEGRPPVKTSGKRLSSDGIRARDASSAMNRLQSTGRMDDGVAALLALSK